MEKTPFAFDQWSELCQSQYENTLKASSIGVEYSEKILNLHINFIKDLFKSTAEAFQGINDVKNPRSFSELHETFTKPTIDKSMAASNAIYETLAEMQQKIMAISFVPMAKETGASAQHLSKSEESALKKSSQRAAEQL
jgi:phasin family protein